MGEKCLDGAKMEIVSTGLFVWILFSGSVHSESFFLSLVASKLNVGGFFTLKSCILKANNKDMDNKFKVK